MAELYRHLLVEGGKQVYTPVLSLLGIFNDGKLGFYLHGLTMEGSSFWRTIYNRCAHIEHHGVLESSEDYLIADAVGVAMRDCHANFLIHRYI